MPSKETILLALDNSANSKRAVKYVADMIGGNRNFTVRLLHILDPVPPQLREFRGSEDPALEKKLDHELDVKWEGWTKAAKKAAQPIFDGARSALMQAGFERGAIRTEFWLPVNREDFVSDVLKVGDSNDCRTIVVGRQSLTGLKGIFHHPLADELVRKAKGFTVWVVE